MTRKFKLAFYTSNTCEARAFENVNTANGRKVNILKTCQMVCNFPAGKPLENGIVLEISLLRFCPFSQSSLIRTFHEI